MKKILFLVASIFLVESGAYATKSKSITAENRYLIAACESEPIEFIERGIVFYVFPDGQFDFNTAPTSPTIVYQPSRRSTIITANSTPDGFRKVTNGVRIDIDNYGRIRRVGSVFLNYDQHNRIKRIGSVLMSYNRHSLVQVGGLQIVYNHRGQIVHYIGSVKGYGNGYQNNYCYEENNDIDYGYNNPTYYYKNEIKNQAISLPKRGRRH